MRRQTEPELAWSSDIELPLVQFCDLCQRRWYECSHHRRHLHFIPDLSKIKELRT